MDVLSLAGIVLGIAAILLGNMLDGGLNSALLNGSAAIVVFGGTFAAVMVQTPLVVMLSAFKRCFWFVFPPKFHLDDLLTKLCKWAHVARQEGLIGLEGMVKNAEPLAQKGLSLLADGQPPSAIRASLELDLYRQEDKGLQGAHVYESLGGYAPTIGIMGAILGLMQVLSNLSSPDDMGPGIASAFVATLYGVGSANLIFLPLAERLKFLVRKEYIYNELMIEGLVAISEGEHPKSIRYRYESLKKAGQ
ncbi:flagellar motor protein [Oceaniserpentilla sp. 4NH20-0058]|uniref:flagellar motor protein n=1 Tax=Oceaniserpentilla sp. 4NH20-0058 TaxID=3127660 RepID=UPI00310957DE